VPDLDQLIAQWGYPGIVAIVLLGNMGVPVPEETALIVAGYLVWQGQLRLPIVLVVAVVSAVAGDNVGYALGWWFGQRAVERVARWAAVDAERMASMRGFVSRYGALAVFGGRFIPGLRFLAGPLAGASGLGFRSFFVANAFGAAVFVPYGVGLGYAIGYGLAPYIAEVRLAERVVLVGAILCVGGYVGRMVWARGRR
jgi:membrane protein DedA with SNARE-associated domain